MATGVFPLSFSSSPFANVYGIEEFVLTAKTSDAFKNTDDCGMTFFLKTPPKS